MFDKSIVFIYVDSDFPPYSLSLLFTVLLYYSNINAALNKTFLWLAQKSNGKKGSDFVQNLSSCCYPVGYSVIQVIEPADTKRTQSYLLGSTSLSIIM